LARIVAATGGTTPPLAIELVQRWSTCDSICPAMCRLRRTMVRPDARAGETSRERRQHRLQLARGTGQQHHDVRAVFDPQAGALPCGFSSTSPASGTIA
jgi:hypothetical protein